MSRVCPYCSSEHVKSSGNLLGRACRRLIGRPRFRCRECLAAWFEGAHGPERVHTRRSIVRRHPVASLALAVLALGVVFLALALLGIVPGMVDRARKAKIVTGNSGKKYTVEGAIDRVHERKQERQQKEEKEEPAKPESGE
jgi:hypothetical protein